MKEQGMGSQTTGQHAQRQHASIIAHDTTRLEVTHSRADGFSIAAVVAALKSDQVILIRDATERDADQIIGEVAAQLGLRANLEAQAAFASVHGHRENVSEFFMTVNRRRDFAIILPHSEGSRSTNIQLASFYCHQNTTDGGVSVLLNYDQDSSAWHCMQERVARIHPSNRSLTAAEKAIVRAKFLAEEFPLPEDQVIEEWSPGIAGIRLLWVLTRLRKSFSSPLQREVYTCWDSVATLDLRAATECVRLMEHYGLLREPVNGPRIDHCDPAYRRAIWRSGVSYDRLYKSLIIRKLAPGELLIQNNLTWAHAASNWTPGSGVRNIVAAFA
jgi:hypothetical protein